jgi:phosphoserine/homoserine phosphotransferase
VLIVCLDLEGVLIPEVWVEFARRSGIQSLTRTTREEPDYDKLMRFRLRTLAEHGMKIGDIQRVIQDMSPLPGARAFLDDLRASYQVVILSDTFYEFAHPLMEQLARPTLFCHSLVVADDGAVVDYKLRLPDQKRAAVNSFKALNFDVIAAGDSYNDTAMLGAADAGFFIHPPAAIAAQFPQFPVATDYRHLRRSIDGAVAALKAARQAA